MGEIGTGTEDVSRDRKIGDLGCARVGEMEIRTR